MQYDYNLKGISITSNRPLHYPPGKAVDAECDVAFRVGSVARRTGFRHMSDFYSVDGDRLYFEASPVSPLVFKMYIEGIMGNHTLVECNRAYYSAVKGVVGQLHPPEVHLHDILVVKLIASGMTPIHAAAVEIDGKCLVIAAPPSTGKSCTCAVAVSHGAKMMFDDGVLTDGSRISPMIWITRHTNTTLLRGLHRDDMKSRVLQTVNESLPFLRYIVRLSSFPVRDLNVPIIESGTVDAVVILANGDRTVRELGKDDALDRLLAINRRELHYFKNEVLLAYACFRRDFDMRELMETEHSILRKLVRNNPVFLCTAPNPYEFWETICEGGILNA
jgi:hypothetical protein